MYTTINVEAPCRKQLSCWWLQIATLPNELNLLIPAILINQTSQAIGLAPN